MKKHVVYLSCFRSTCNNICLSLSQKLIFPITAIGHGGQSAPQTSDWEISAIYREKRGKEKMENGRNGEEKLQKGSENWKWKVEKVPK